MMRSSHCGIMGRIMQRSQPTLVQLTGTCDMVDEVWGHTRQHLGALVTHTLHSHPHFKCPTYPC
jgi:hypothetical protein